MSDSEQRWGRKVATMAVIAGAGVAVIYVPQPIQTLVADEFGVDGAGAAWATIAVQAGYALGIGLLVALGDRVSTRRQATVQIVATAAALGVAAAAPGYAVYTAMMLVAGATASVAQLLVGAALRLAPPTARARTAAVLLGSIIVGLFAVRTGLGALAEALGWRGALAVCAVLVLALVPLSLRAAPADRPSDPPAYGRILASIPRVAASSPTLRIMTGIHTTTFMAFIALWSMTTVHAVDELGLRIGEAALIGIAGLVGGAITIGAASVHGRIGARRSLAACMALAVGGVAIATAGSGSPLVMAVGLLMVSAGMSSEQVSTQAIGLASVAPEQNGRANTVFMGSTFLGGSIATAVASVLLPLGGFVAVGVFAFALAVTAASLAVIANRRGMLGAAGR